MTSIQQALPFLAAFALLVALPGIHWVFTLFALGCVGLSALQKPAWIVAAVVLSIPVQSAVLLPFVRGELTVTQVLLFGLIAGWGALIWKRRIWLDSITIGFLLVMAACVVSFIATDSGGMWFQETYRWAIAGLLYVIARSVLTTWDDVRLNLWAMTAGVVGVCAYALAQFAMKMAPDQFVVGGAVRVYGTFGTPNTMAAYIELTVPILIIAAWLIWTRPRRGTRFLLAAMVLASVMGVATMALTQSRGGWVGLAVAFLVLGSQLPRRTQVTAAIAVLAIVGVFALTAPGRSQLERFSSLIDEPEKNALIADTSDIQDSTGRRALWRAARSMFMDHPWTGVGAGEFDEHYREYTPSWFNRFPRGQAHNVWLQMGAQAGIWGILAYAAWLGASVWALLTAWHRASSQTARKLLLGILAVFAAFVIHSMVDYLNVLSLGLQLSVITAVGLNMAPDPLTRYRPVGVTTPQGVISVPE